MRSSPLVTLLTLTACAVDFQGLQSLDESREPPSVSGANPSAPDLGDGGAMQDATLSRPDADPASSLVDQCPDDPSKLEPGQCGCGVEEGSCDMVMPHPCLQGTTEERAACECAASKLDNDGDGTPDCADACKDDPYKQLPGDCGCGKADSDTDGDGRLDCDDGCPSDKDKQSLGQCGCGVADVDTDRDGVLDCNDGCPSDKYKQSLGKCGCGVADVDTDRDGVVDCNDGCPGDKSKQSAGTCGCGVADVDTDRDGALDCVDKCPLNGAKTVEGVCGCDVLDEDVDEDDVVDCVDACVGTYDTSGRPGCACTKEGAKCDNRPPTLSIVQPSTGSVKRGKLGVEAVATDDGSIVGVNLFIDGRLVRQEGTSPYLWGNLNSAFSDELEDLPVGLHRLEVAARDDEGATTRVGMDVTVMR